MSSTIKSAVAETRSSTGPSKPPSRLSNTVSRRSITSSKSTPSARSRLSVSASEDEKKPSGTIAAKRTTNSSVSSPGRPVDKKIANMSQPSASTRKSTTRTLMTSTRSSAAAPLSRTASNTLRGTTRSTPLRPGPKSQTGDAQPQNPTSSMSGLPSRTTSRTVAKAELTMESAKEIQELKSQLSQGNSEIESLNSKLMLSAAKIAELQEQLERSANIGDDIAPPSPGAASNIHGLDNTSTAVTLEAEVDSSYKKGRMVETNPEEHQTRIVEVMNSKNANASLPTEATTFKITREKEEVDSAERVAAAESALQKALVDHASEMKGIRAEYEKATSYYESAALAHETLLAELKSEHASHVNDLQKNMEDLKKSHTGLQFAKDAATLEQEETTLKLTNIQNETQELKEKLETSNQTVERIRGEKDNAIQQVSQLNMTLCQKMKELEIVTLETGNFRTKAENVLGLVTEKEAEISKLKTMHDERMKELSQDYENEIESLRGDAFFKRKFEELQTKHEGLVESSSKKSEDHAREIEAINGNLSGVIAALKSQIEEYEKNLSDVRVKHAEELEAVKHNTVVDVKSLSAEIDSLKLQHAKHVDTIKSQYNITLAAEIEQLREKHATDIETLKTEYADRETRLLIQQAAELSVVQQTANSVHETELARLQNEVADIKDELEQAQLQNTRASEIARQENAEMHAAEVENLVKIQRKAMDDLKEEVALAKRKEQELANGHSKTIDDLKSDIHNKSMDHEEKLARQIATNTELHVAHNAAQKSLIKALSEIEELSQQLAQERMKNVSVLAELDAARGIADANAELEGVKQALATAKELHEESISAFQAELATKGERLNAAEIELSVAQDAVVGMKRDLELALHNLDMQKINADAKEKTSLHDYNVLKNNTTVLLSEANSKTTSLESEIDNLKQKLGNTQRKSEELHYKPTHNDTEMAEAENQVAGGITKPHSLARSIFANSREGFVEAPTNDVAAEGENDDNHSSAALASLSKARLTAKQIDALDREMRHRNLQLLNSIIDINKLNIVNN